MKKMKIVIVSYAGYPTLAPRSQRTTELAKGFAKVGHDVTLYMMTGGFDFTDFEKETNIKVKSLGKTTFIKFNYKTGTQYSFFTRVIKKLFGKYLEFPNIELMQKVYKSLRGESNIDLLVSIAVPYPIHWGVAYFKQKHPEKMINTTWVADCGDPYMGNPFHKHPFYFKNVEKWFSNKTDFITIPIEEAVGAYYPEFRDKIKIIPQGFDFDAINIDGNYKENTVPTFIYAGVFYENNRDPRPLLDYLIKNDTDFKFIVYTRSIALLEPYINVLQNKLIIRNYIPREELLVEMSKADFLLNLENPTQVQSPSKLIDYALSKRPVLSLNTNVELDKVKIDEFLKGDYSQKLVIENINQYNIDNIVKEFEELVEK